MSQINKVLYDFDAEEEGEMTVRAGDIVKVLPQSEGPDGDDDDRNGWIFVKATRTGQRGYVPLDYIEPTESPAAMKSPISMKTPQSTQGMDQQSYGQSRDQNQTPIRQSESSGQDQIQSTPQEKSPAEVGMRLSLAALVNAQSSDKTAQVQPQASTSPDVLPPPPAPLEPESEPKQYGLDKLPFGMEPTEPVYPKHSPGKKSKSHSAHSVASSFAKSSGSSKAKGSALSKFKKSANMVQNMVRVSSAVAAPRVPSLASAVDREDWEELTKRNDEYFARLVSSQAETFDSLTDMVDALSKKLNDATKSSHDLVSKLSELDELIDEEKRKWKSQYEAEKNAEVLGRSKQLMSSTDGSADFSRSISPRGQ